MYSHVHASKSVLYIGGYLFVIGGSTVHVYANTVYISHV